MSEWVTRSPIELLWTAKNRKQMDVFKQDDLWDVVLPILPSIHHWRVISFTHILIERWQLADKPLCFHPKPFQTVVKITFETKQSIKPTTYWVMIKAVSISNWEAPGGGEHKCNKTVTCQSTQQGASRSLSKIQIRQIQLQLYKLVQIQVQQNRYLPTSQVCQPNRQGTYRSCSNSKVQVQHIQIKIHVKIQVPQKKHKTQNTNATKTLPDKPVNSMHPDLNGF